MNKNCLFLDMLHLQVIADVIKHNFVVGAPNTDQAIEFHIFCMVSIMKTIVVCWERNMFF